ncbi:MAG: hypothetical protein U1F57_07880 [bacterium]
MGSGNDPAANLGGGNLASPPDANDKNGNPDNPAGNSANPPPPAATPLSTGVNGPLSDPVTCPASFPKNQLLDLCFVNSSHEEAKFYLRGYLMGEYKDPPAKLDLTNPDCPHVVSGFLLKTDEAPHVADPPFAYPGSYVRFVDKLNKRYVETVLDAQGNFEVIYKGPKNTHLSVELAPVGFTPSDTNVVHDCGSSPNNPCEPGNYRTVAMFFYQLQEDQVPLCSTRKANISFEESPASPTPSSDLPSFK